MIIHFGCLLNLSQLQKWTTCPALHRTNCMGRTGHQWATRFLPAHPSRNSPNSMRFYCTHRKPQSNSARTPSQGFLF
jgi:hypothetical protein